MMDHANHRPQEAAPVHVIIVGHLDERGHHDGSQVHLPAARTDSGDVWITPSRITFVDPDAPLDQPCAAELAQAAQDAAMHQRHATELRAVLISIGDAIIRAINALAAGAQDPLRELHQWLRRLQLTAAESGDRDHQRDREPDHRAEVTCTITGRQPLRRLRVMAAELDLTPDQLASAFVMAALTGSATPRHEPHLTPLPG